MPVATGRGGAVATVDPTATGVGLQVLRDGGNAVDAAVAAGAALGVTEPYSAGIGGGGFLVHYDASSGRVSTLDGRETAPAATGQDHFIDPRTGEPYAFADAVNSGLSVGVPGTPLLWDRALELWGTIGVGEALRPAIRVARRGFTVDETFREQTASNADRFRDIAPTRELFLPGGEPPEVGRPSATATSQRHTAGSQRTASTPSTKARSRGRSPAPSRTHRSHPTPTRSSSPAR